MYVMLGSDIETFKQHIESQFEEGMSWDNYGEWEFDHIIPIKFNDPTIKQVITRLHYTNTQPLWKEDNNKKLNNYCGKSYNKDVNKMDIVISNNEKTRRKTE